MSLYIQTISKFETNLNKLEYLDNGFHSFWGLSKAKCYNNLKKQLMVNDLFLLGNKSYGYEVYKITSFFKNNDYNLFMNNNYSIGFFLKDLKIIIPYDNILEFLETDRYNVQMCINLTKNYGKTLNDFLDYYEIRNEYGESENVENVSENINSNFLKMKYKIREELKQELKEEIIMEIKEEMVDYLVLLFEILILILFFYIFYNNHQFIYKFIEKKYYNVKNYDYKQHTEPIYDTFSLYYYYYGYKIRNNPIILKFINYKTKILFLINKFSLIIMKNVNNTINDFYNFN